MIARHMDMIQSYAISAHEAARRGETAFVELHMRQIKHELMRAIAQFKAMGE